MSTTILDAEVVDVPDGHELVNGELKEVPPMSAYACAVANRLNVAMIRHDQTFQLGRAHIEMYFKIPTKEDPQQIRRPDLAFVYSTTWPDSLPMSYTGNAFDIRPELVVEVLSPNDDAEELMSKMRQYLKAGVKCVWIVYPAVQEIHCYEGKSPPRTYGIEDILDGGTVLPGFQVKVESLFPPIIPGSVPDSREAYE